MSLTPMDEDKSRKRRSRKSWPRKSKPRKRRKASRINTKTIAATVARKVAMGIELTEQERAWQDAMSTLNQEVEEGTRE